MRNVPKLRFLECTKEWEQSYISDVISSKSKKYNPENNDVNYTSIELESLSQDSGELLSTFDSKNQKSIKNVFNSGDVLFGKLRPYLKKYYLADFDGVCSSEIWVLKSSILESNYLYAFVQSNSFMSLTEISSGSKMPRADWNLVSSSLISYPSNSDERKKIGKIIHLLNSRIHTQKKIIDNLEYLMLGFHKKLIAREIRFKDENKQKFPEWEVKTLGEISIITTGASNREDSILDGEFTFFDRSQDIRSSNRYLFDKEAIIVPGEGQVFVPKYFKGKFDLHQRTYAIFDFIGISGKFLYYHILNDDKHLQSQAVGSTVKSLRLPMFKSMPIKIPSFDEQIKIAQFLSSLEMKTNIERDLLINYEHQKKYLLANLFI